MHRFSKKSQRIKSNVKIPLGKINLLQSLYKLETTYWS